MDALTDRPPGIVLFAEDFDAPPRANETVPEPEIIEPTFTAADLEDARRKAWQAGHDAAAEAAEQANGAAVRDSVGAIATNLADAAAQMSHVAQQAAEEIARLLLSSFGAALPSLCAHYGEAELRSLVHTLLPILTQEPAVTIRLNPANTTAVTQEIERIDPDLAARLQFVASDTIAPGDIRVSWRAGQAVRDTAALWAQVVEILAPAGLLDHAETRETEHVG